MDIRGLSKSGGPAEATHSIPRPRKRWATRIALPAGIALATAALLAYAARDLLLPATPVEIVRAVATPTSTAAGGSASAVSPGKTVAQAPGWVEPDPYPTFASALTPGVVQDVLVLEGQRVTKGQELIRLVAEDAELSVQQAQAEVDRQAALHEAAKTDFENPVALERAVAVNEAMLAEAKALLTKLDAEVASQQAKLAEFKANYDRVSRLGGDSASRLQVEQAQYQMQSQQAVVEATRQQRPALEAGVQRYEAELAAARRDLELKVSIKRSYEESAAALHEAQVRLAEAQLRLSRMVIHAPVDGVVMNRLVSPGDKLMLTGDMAHSAHAIHLYDPRHLQVRVDVPLADAAKVGVGQKATIVVDVLPDVEFQGEVTRFVHLADIGKNTVQVKVQIHDPSPLLKPDMLARVNYFGSAGGSANEAGPGVAGTTSDSATSVAIQKSAVLGGEDEPYVWVVSADNQRLRRQAVTLGGERDGGWIDVLAGLSPGDAVVASPTPELAEGQRVRINTHTQHQH